MLYNLAALCCGALPCVVAALIIVCAMPQVAVACCLGECLFIGAVYGKVKCVRTRTAVAVGVVVMVSACFCIGVAMPCVAVAFCYCFHIVRGLVDGKVQGCRLKAFWHNIWYVHVADGHVVDAYGIKTSFIPSKCYISVVVVYGVDFSSCEVYGLNGSGCCKIDGSQRLESVVVVVRCHITHYKFFIICAFDCAFE